MKYLVPVFSIVISLPALAKLPKDDWEIKGGKLSYHVNYPLKKVVGTSENVKGKGHCSEKSCEFLVAVPVKTFESGDGNRDNHMLEVTKAALNPMIAAKVSFAIGTTDGAIDARAEVQFAGKSHTYEHIRVNASINGDRAVTTGRIPLLLSDFAVERPSLLTVKIDDAAPVDFELTWAAVK
jgi:hypothetical protein